MSRYYILTDNGVEFSESFFAVNRFSVRKKETKRLRGRKAVVAYANVVSRENNNKYLCILKVDQKHSIGEIVAERANKNGLVESC